MTGRADITTEPAQPGPLQPEPTAIGALEAKLGASPLTPKLLPPLE